MSIADPYLYDSLRPTLPWFHAIIWHILLGVLGLGVITAMIRFTPTPTLIAGALGIIATATVTGWLGLGWSPVLALMPPIAVYWWMERGCFPSSERE